MKYRILKSSYFNEFGEQKDIYFYVQILKSFLWIPYWKTVRHRECSMGHCWDEITKFNLHTDAYEFVQNVLHKKNTANGWKKEIVNEVNLN
jgi:hypothetical protein